MSAPQYDNPASEAKLTEELKRRQRTERERVAEDLSTKQKLERARGEKETTFDVQIDGIPVEFKMPSSNLQERAFSIAHQFEDVDIEEDLDASVAADLVSFMKGAMDQMSTDPDLDADEWGKYDSQTLEEHFESVMLSDEIEMDEGVDPEEVERIDEFRES